MNAAETGGLHINYGKSADESTTNGTGRTVTFFVSHGPLCAGQLYYALKDPSLRHVPGDLRTINCAFGIPMLNMH